ncbi:hypothetical protein DPMN_139786 [Dreissena polymorpha]|uniref:Uncharacterized protein n=1 Tax=Dreissena polymorpha TaxID=45954 RepID=A0A9D4G6D7_DREPO|nr:hypothetical protein DPMN_139786 [Dreissena polymorpha]
MRRRIMRRWAGAEWMRRAVGKAFGGGAALAEGQGYGGKEKTCLVLSEVQRVDTADCLNENILPYTKSMKEYEKNDKEDRPLEFKDRRA